MVHYFGGVQIGIGEVIAGWTISGIGTGVGLGKDFSLGHIVI